ncbi:MAG: chemotaxis protein CheW [Bacteriovoracaceae bacterium]|jgi:purine-binding chemotaxis protein CheW|nr:chemotaxis protein CheW [Bacteriovoracaceae bacterium]
MENEKDHLSLQFCGFKIGGDEFGIPVELVQEVIKPLPVTTVPLSQNTIRGLINLRGQIVTCISLRNLFGLEEDLSANHMNIIVRGDEGLFAFVVDEVTDIVELDKNNLELTPETLKQSLKSYVDYIYKKEDGLQILLNTKKIIKAKANAKEITQLSEKQS